jgi:hypothetical protein
MEVGMMDKNVQVKRCGNEKGRGGMLNARYQG